MKRNDYRTKLRDLQIGLTILQRHIIRYEHKILVIFEGRDASGKDGAIKRITRHLSPRETRVVALGKPTQRETAAWYFQRHVAQLPVASEMVIFNRSWYNRAGVEKVMGYCTEDEYQVFIETVNDFESLLIRSGINLLKYYLDISYEEQSRRLAARRTNPLAQWKVSPVDDSALEKWDAYSTARDEMFRRTHTEESPWTIIRTDNKRLARLNVMRDILHRVDCPDKDKHFVKPDTEIVFPYTPERSGQAIR